MGASHTPIPPTEWAYRVVDDKFEFGKMEDDGTVPEGAWQDTVPGKDDGWEWKNTSQMYALGMCWSCTKMRTVGAKKYCVPGQGEVLC